MNETRSSPTRVRRIAPLLLAALALAGAGWWWQRSPAGRAPGAPPPASEPVPAGTTVSSADERGYVSSEACRKCHAEEYASWHDSYHRTMTQAATPETIAAPMEGAHLEAYGRQYDFSREGDVFYVSMLSPEQDQSALAAGRDLGRNAGARRERHAIVQVTGSHLMQTYWIRGSDGLRQVPWYWNLEQQRWIPSEDSFLRPPDAGRQFIMWDAICIKCHAVAGIPGFDMRRKYSSSVVEMGIACEACHGPGREHVQHQERLAALGDGAGTDERDTTIVQPKRLSHEAASQVCAQCHSATRFRDLVGWLTKGPSFRPGGDFEAHLREVRFDPASKEDAYYVGNGYWGDGTYRTGGDEHLGLSRSACYERGELSCLSCHSLHGYADRTDQLKPRMDGNEACYQCHEDYRERLAEHTHHAPDSSGSLCYDCHMPHSTYALFKGIRSHRIDSPSVATLTSGRPNACNLCHLDRSLEWTRQNLVRWYGAPDVPLTQDPEQGEVAAGVRWLLAGDAAQRVIATWHFGWGPALEASPGGWQPAILAFALDDPYAAIRIVARNALRGQAGFETFEPEGDAAGRARSVQRALELWRHARSGVPATHEAVLLDAQGELRVEAVQALLHQRDDRALEIPE